MRIAFTFSKHATAARFAELSGEELPACLVEEKTQKTYNETL